MSLSIFVSHPSHFLTDHQPHGDGLIAHSFISKLAERGHRVHVATPLSDLRGPLPKTVCLHPVYTASRPSAGGISFTHRLEYAMAVRVMYERIRKKESIDIIHQLNPIVLGISALLYGLGVPLVVGPYWPSWESGVGGPSHCRFDYRHGLKNLVRRISFSRCDALLSPTQVSTLELLASGASQDRLFPLNIGIDADLFSPATEQPDPLSILFLANLMTRKGIFVLLKAFNILADRLPDCTLTVGGAGPEERAVREYVKQMRNSGQVRLIGNVSRERVPQMLRRCSVYCLPSFGEPFGMSALEAMSCGKPLVVTNTGGLNCLVREGGGLKVAPSDAVALADALENLLSDTRMQRRFGQFNRELVLREYAWDKVTDQLESIYHRLISGRAKRKSLPSFNPWRPCDR